VLLSQVQRRLGARNNGVILVKSFNTVKIIQSAFKKTLTDRDLQAHAKERKLDIDPVAGEELSTRARAVIAQPNVVERMKRLLEKRRLQPVHRTILSVLTVTSACDIRRPFSLSEDREGSAFQGMLSGQNFRPLIKSL